MVRKTVWFMWKQTTYCWSLRRLILILIYSQNQNAVRKQVHGQCSSLNQRIIRYSCTANSQTLRFAVTWKVSLQLLFHVLNVGARPWSPFQARLYPNGYNYLIISLYYSVFQWIRRHQTFLLIRGCRRWHCRFSIKYEPAICDIFKHLGKCISFQAVAKGLPSLHHARDIFAQPEPRVTFCESQTSACTEHGPEMCPLGSTSDISMDKPTDAGHNSGPFAERSYRVNIV